MIIPIRTEMVARRTPTTNYALIFINCISFALFHMFYSKSVMSFRDDYLILDAAWPSLHQFFTYQFLHADAWHLGGNMLFLWVFGNSVNAKMGDWGYLFFYLACGVFSATLFAFNSYSPLLGASGAIAGVTTAYLVLFPRSRVTVLVWIFILHFFEVPAMLLIGVKVILWDNIIAPSGGGADNIAYSAHLAGYLFGFVGATTMLAVKAIPRDHFDMLALIDRWNRRRVFRAAMASPDAQRRAMYGSVARTSNEGFQDAEKLDAITDARYRVGESLDRGDDEKAVAEYERLISVDEEQCLPAQQQIRIARAFLASGKTPQAASAFAQYLKSYRDGYEADEIRLLLGIIYARDLKQYNTADELLTQTMVRVKDGPRRAQCLEWLNFVRQQLGKPPYDA